MAVLVTTTRLFGLDIVNESLETVHARLSRILIQDELPSREGVARPMCIYTPNPEQIVYSWENAEFKAALATADMLIPDGAGLVLYSRLLALRGRSVPLTERITGIDLVTKLLKTASEESLTVLVVGGRGYGVPTTAAQPTTLPGVAQLAVLDTATATQSFNHNWFWSEGYKTVTAPEPDEEHQLTEVLTSLRPDIVFVAFGAPQQEWWLASHKALLTSCGVKVAMAVGGSFDVLTGKLRRAPGWIRRLHLEWIFRLFQEPWRWRRQAKLLLFIKGAAHDLFSNK